MNSLKTYIPSVIISLLTVFTLLAVSALVVVGETADSEHFRALITEEKIVEKTRSEIEKYFKDKYNESGIPAEAYSQITSDEYIFSTCESYIDAAFGKLENGGEFTVNKITDADYEKGMSDFFNDYADSVDYDERDEKFEAKIEKAVNEGYSAVRKYCDVFKLKAIDNQGLFDKLGGIYSHLDSITLAVAILTGVLLVVLVLINIKNLRAISYWFGISALISGIIGLAPALYLTATNYFDSFVVKQPHIFSAFTGLMYGAVDAFAVQQIILAVAGAVLIAVFAVLSLRKKDSTEKK